MREKTTWLFELKDLSDDDFRHLQKKMDKMGHEIKDIEHRDAFSASRKGAVKFKGQLTDIRREIPLLDRGLSLLASPLGLAAAAVTGVGIVMHKTNKAAKEFNHQFLELKNLNLDKTEAQLERLRESVLNTSFYGGLDATRAAQAYFDVQSATGKYGKEVDNIVSQIGKFSTSVKSDLNATIEGAAKAMGIFGFGAGQMDDFLASSGKVVQMGITTFDQFSKVQVEYAGAAAAANQGFEEANKLFAAFSKNAKSVDIAANLTKTAFEDLTKGSTIRGFKELAGVDLFDSNDQMRKMTDIAGDLVPELQKMSDLEFANFKEEVGGSIGLKALLDQLKVAGDDVLQTFEDFEKLDFDGNKAFQNALNDAETLDGFLSNKLNASMIRLGEASMPITNFFNKLGIVSLDKISDFIQGTSDLFSPEARAESEKLTAAFHTQKALKNKFDYEEFENLPADQQQSRVKNWEKLLEDERKKSELDKSYEWGVSEETQGKALGKSRFLENMIAKYGISEKKDEILLNSDGTPISEGDGNGDAKTTISGIEAVNKMRNVTVNISSLVNELRYYDEQGGMTDQEIEQKMVELLVRAVRDAEIALG